MWVWVFAQCMLKLRLNSLFCSDCRVVFWLQWRWSQTLIIVFLILCLQTWSLSNSKFVGNNNLGFQFLCQGANNLISGGAGYFCVTLEILSPLCFLSILQPALSLLLCSHETRWRKIYIYILLPAIAVAPLSIFQNYFLSCFNPFLGVLLSFSLAL